MSVLSGYYNQILSLARGGNPVRAWERFGALGLADRTDDIKALTLKGRLLKDLGDRAEGAERLRFFGQASQAYLAANELKTDTYPLINAATLALLSQDTKRAGELATEVLQLIEANPDEGETPYWREATKAEAHLLLGQRDRAEAALAKGISNLPRAWEDHAATIGQFERIMSARSESAAWLDAFRPPSSVHFSGLIGLDADDPELCSAIKLKASELSPGFAFGALAAGADILFAEALLEAGALLHVTLPFACEQFRKVSVEPYGDQWCARFDALIESAETIEELWDAGEDAAKWLPQLVDAANLVGMGQSLRRAETLRTGAHAVAVMAKGEPIRSHLGPWQDAGLPVHWIETKRVSNGPSASVDRTGAVSAPTIMSVNGIDPVSAEGTGLEVFTDGEAVRSAAALSECLSAAREIQDADPNATIGLVTNPIADEGAAEAASLLAGRLAQSASHGQIYADHHTAMIAKVLRPACRVEEMGEVGTLSGPRTVYAITAQ